jgi:hypothetical protein
MLPAYHPDPQRKHGPEPFWRYMATGQLLGEGGPVKIVETIFNAHFFPKILKKNKEKKIK